MRAEILLKKLLEILKKLVKKGTSFIGNVSYVKFSYTPVFKAKL